MEDEKIIELYFQRSEDAIPETELKYGSRCRAVAYNILASREDSEECVNDTYLAVWNAIPPTVPLYLGAYIVGIARKLSLSLLRYRCADRRGRGEYALCFDELSDCIAEKDSPEAHIELQELAAEINRFLSTLSHDDRKIFLCRYWLMASMADIAKNMDCSESRIKSSLHRSRGKLKKHLIKEGLL